MLEYLHIIAGDGKKMRALLSKIFYLISIIGFLYSFYNAGLVVDSLFRKSREISSDSIYEEAYGLIYIAVGSFAAAFIFYLISRKISRKS